MVTHLDRHLVDEIALGLVVGHVGGIWVITTEISGWVAVTGGESVL